ncbi:unnamed protein product, partial [Rotaria socialis]
MYQSASHKLAPPHGHIVMRVYMIPNNLLRPANSSKENVPPPGPQQLMQQVAQLQQQIAQLQQKSVHQQQQSQTQIDNLQQQHQHQFNNIQQRQQHQQFTATNPDE